MNTSVDRKRISIFLAFAFGIAWFFGGLLYLLVTRPSGGQALTPVQQTLSLIFLTVGYMGAPALANVLTRIITREGWDNLWLSPRLKQGWVYWVIAWVAPGLLTLVGVAVFFLLFPRYYDPSMPFVQEQLQKSGVTLPFSTWALFWLQTVQAILIAPLINSLFTFGEEFGWRAYLLQKLLPLGKRRALLLLGVIWGIWHAPIIAQGHNYGTQYPGYPWLGILAMTIFTIGAGTFLGWATLKAGSVWPAVIGHAAINGIAGLGIILSTGEPNPVLGPTVAGLIGGAGFLLAGLILLLVPWKVSLPAEN
jgi:membrane protease YdiL (CAAX protease family)